MEKVHLTTLIKELQSRLSEHQSAARTRCALLRGPLAEDCGINLQGLCSRSIEQTTQPFRDSLTANASMDRDLFAQASTAFPSWTWNIVARPLGCSLQPEIPLMKHGSERSQMHLFALHWTYSHTLYQPGLEGAFWTRKKRQRGKG